MASTYTTQLRLEKPAAGDYDNTWDLVWNNTLPLIEQGIGGYATIAMASDANMTLSTADGADDQSRNMVLNVTSGVSLTVTRSIIVPNVEKVYIVTNNTTGGQAIRIATASPSATVDIPNGRTCLVYVNGTGESAVLVGTVIPDGSASTPGLGFQNDNDTGLYLNTTNTIGFTAGGTLQLTISTTASTFSQPVLIPNGTSDAPALGPSGDTNTGFFFPSADTARLTVGGKTTISADTQFVVIAPNFTTSATFSTDNVSFPFPVIVSTSGTYAAPTITFDNEESTGIYRHSANVIGITNTGATTVTVAQDAFTITPQTVFNTTGDHSDPPITFAGDLNTGIYRSADGEISITCNGTQVISFNTTGTEPVAPILFGDGSASAPSVAHSGDVDTGIYFPAANQVAISGNTQNIITFTTASITPSFPILFQNGSVTEPSITNTGDTNTGLYFPSDDAIGMTAGGSVVITVTSTGVTATTPVVFSSTHDEATPAITFTDDTTTGVYWDSVGKIGVSSESNPVITFDGDGTHAVTPIMLSTTGDATAPALTFEGDVDTGIYSSAENTLALSAGGSDILSLTTTSNTSSVPIFIPAGSVSAPSLSFTGDTNTGLYSPAGDSVSVAGNGAVMAAFSTTGTTVYSGGTQVAQFTSTGLDVDEGGVSVDDIPVVHGKYVNVSSTPYAVSTSVDFNGAVYGVNTSPTDMTVNLPSVASISGYRITIFKGASANELIINADGSDLIDAFSQIRLYSIYDSVTLVSNGARWVATEGIIADYVETITASDASYALKPGCVQIEAYLLGGGGGGGGITGSATTPSGAVGAGGGGGGGLHVISGNMSSVSTLNITIGAAGAAGANTGGTGGAGGDTTIVFGSNTWMATGGAGGAGNTVKTTTGAQAALHGFPGSGGISSGTNYTIFRSLPGGYGGHGMLVIEAASVGTSGAGGCGAFGGIGGIGRVASVAGAAGAAYGGGGGGALNVSSNTARAGGAGAAGVVVLRQILLKRRY